MKQRTKRERESERVSERERNVGGGEGGHTLQVFDRNLHDEKYKPCTQYTLSP
jgi:hypothetical protein